MEESIFIQRNISHYEAILKLKLDAQTRAAICRLLAEAEHSLAVATSLEQSAPGLQSGASSAAWESAEASECDTDTSPGADILTFRARAR